MLEDLDKYVFILLAALGLFSAIARVTPTEADNRIVDTIYKFVQKLGLNKNPE